MYLIAGRGRKSATQKRTADAAAPSSQSQLEHQQQQYSRSEDPDFGQDFGYGDIDETDLDDPGLLGEFEALRAEMGLSQAVDPGQKQKHAQQAQQAQHRHIEEQHARDTVVNQQEQALAGQPGHTDVGFSDDDQALEAVVVTEEDMDDPHLLAELAKISGGNATTSAEKSAEKSAKLSAASVPGTNAEPAIAIASASVSQPAAVSPEDASSIGVLAERAAQFKAAALAAKRAEDMSAARGMLLQMKDAQTAIDLLRSGRGLPSGYVVPPPPSLSLPSQQPADARSKGAGAKTQSKQPATAARQTKPASVPAPAQAKPAKPAAARKPVQAQTTASAAHASEPRLREVMTDSAGGSFEEMARSFDAMKSKLESQAAEATRMAAYFLKSGDKAMALEFHRLKKRATADLAVVASYEANGRSQPPAFLHREVRWSAPGEQQRDISASELQVAIRRMVSAGDLAATLGGQADFYIQWETAWPKDRGSKAYTRTMRWREFDDSQGDLDIGYQRNVEFVDRLNVRPLLRWVDRGKLTVELYKYMGLLWGSQLIGRATLPLAGLRSSSEVAALVELKPASAALGRADRSLVGGAIFVDVAARLRLPLSNKPEKVVYSERWIYVDSQPEPQEYVLAREQPPAQVQGQTRVSEQPQAPPQSSAGKSRDRQQEEESAQLAAAPPPPPSSKPGNSAHVAEAEVAKPSAAPTAPVQDAPTAEDIAAQMDIMDTTVSNAVLELELLQIPARMQDTSDAKAASELEDLASAIKLRMSVVAAQVGAGVMTIQDYMAGVEKEVALNKDWALAAKRLGRRDLAARALRRIKAMQAELDEMRQAMDADGEADGDEET